VVRPDGRALSRAYGRDMTTKNTDPVAPVIIVGYDGSPTSRAAADHAARHAGPKGTVYLVHSYGLPADWLGFPNYQRVLDDHRSRGEVLLDAFPTAGGPMPTTNFETELLGGPPAEAITAVADARHADEIVIGSRGLSRLHSALGSVSHDVLHRATVPVVVIPFVHEPA
jgi:nucleotide-binding universal stress UspA family protein